MGTWTGKRAAVGCAQFTSIRTIKTKGSVAPISWLNPSLQLVQGGESNGVEGLRAVLEQKRRVSFLAGPQNSSLDNSSCSDNAVAPSVQPSFYRRGDRPSEAWPPRSDGRVSHRNLSLAHRRVGSARLARPLRQTYGVGISDPIFYFIFIVTSLSIFFKPCPLRPSRSLLGSFPLSFQATWLSWCSGSIWDPRGWAALASLLSLLPLRSLIPCFLLHF